MKTRLARLDRQADWSGLTFGVAGLGVAGFAAADALLQMGASVVVVDGQSGPRQQERGKILEILGADIRLGTDTLPENLDVLVVSPGLPVRAPIILAAQASGVPVWGELELAWRLRPTQNPAAWLTVTGTNGKTTTTLMLESMLRAGGLRVVAAGNIGVSLVETVMAEEETGLDVIAVEVGAPQLPFVYSMSPLASVCLNVAEDHVDIFGSMDDYTAAKGRIYENTRVACVYNVDEPITEQLVENADVVEGCRAVGFTLSVPSVSMFGVVDGILVDRAFLPERKDHALELAPASSVVPHAPHNVANALAAAALARAYGVSPAAIHAGLRSFTPAGHRIADVGTVAGVRFIDDSKATNCHAAQTSLEAFEPVVWIAGGMAKGQSFDDLIVAIKSRLRAVVLLGVDRGIIRDALARHAPDVPVAEVTATDHGAMTQVVGEAVRMATSGDTVLLAPGCASWDMFRDYAARGDAFAAAVAALNPGDSKGDNA